MTEIVGVINLTPDSFSDGGKFMHRIDALHQAEKLMADGASLVEFGAQSTRPGSEPVGSEEELRRLRVIGDGGLDLPFGVDTYRSEVAQAMLPLGPRYINDVTGGMESKLLSVVAASNAEVVLMHSRCTSPHQFGPNPEGDIVDHIISSLTLIKERAIRAGVRNEQIILDTGMGGFLSSDAEVSFEVLRRFREITDAFSNRFMLGVSRKGFLSPQKNLSIEERDDLSDEALKAVLPNEKIQYLRVHRVSKVLCSLL